MSTYSYSFFRIPKDNIITYVEKYKQLRLKALSTAPASFSSTHEIESALPDIEWVNRLTATGVETFICAATPTNTDPSTEQGETTWIGQLTLHGPQPRETFILPTESGQKNPPHGVELWQMLSLFTHPDHRGRGLGKRLCQEALGYLRSYRACPRKVWVRLMVKPENGATVSLYRGLGFVEVGKCTLIEALVANGDEALVPESAGEKYRERSGLVMMLEFMR